MLIFANLDRIPCPKGYKSLKGTTLLSRKVQYNKDLFFLQRDECAASCSQKRECKSFEHCNGNRNCGIIDVNLPKVGDNCLKVNGTTVCTNFCILNEVTKPTIDTLERGISYDFCKQDGKYTETFYSYHFTK